MDSTNNIDEQKESENYNYLTQQPELLIQSSSQVQKISPVKQTAAITIIIGLLLFCYNISLIQNPKSQQIFIYFIAGIIFIITGLILIKNLKYGKILFSITTWLSITPFVVLFLNIFMSPLGMLSLLALMLNLSPNIFGQIGLIIGLNIYMHSANRTLSRYIKLNNSVDQNSNIIIKQSKLSYFGLFVICISIAAVLYSNFVPSINPSLGKDKEYETYLENKYNEKFELFDYKTTTEHETSFTTCDKLTAKARPIKNHNITFEISSYTRNCASYDKFYDDYASKLWEYEEKSSVEKKLKEVYGTMPEYDIKITLDSDIVFSKGTPPSINTIIDSNYRPYIFLNTYLDYALTKDNVFISEERVRTMSSFIINELGFTDFYFDYNMKDPKPPTTDVYKGFNVKQSDIRCMDRFSIDSENYRQMSVSDNLEEYYSKICTYDTKESKGGGIARGTYPK